MFNRDICTVRKQMGREIWYIPLRTELKSSNNTLVSNSLTKSTIRNLHTVVSTVKRNNLKKSLENSPKFKFKFIHTVSFVD